MSNNNFETCIYKSKEQYTRPVRICCNKFKEVTAFDCPKREIFPLSENHCNECQEYKNVKN